MTAPWTRTHLPQPDKKPPPYTARSPMMEPMTVFGCQDPALPVRDERGAMTPLFLHHPMKQPERMWGPPVLCRLCSSPGKEKHHRTPSLEVQQK